MKIRQTNLQFGSLTERYDTDAIVIHHSNGGNDVDFSAERIHAMHKNNGYCGIGYHFVIRKDGTIEIGRPETKVGAHAEGHNYYTIGICLSGDFQYSTPTKPQLNALADLIRDLCRDYNIPTDRRHIIGHRELNETDCPGDNLYSQLDYVLNLVNGIATPERVAETGGTPCQTIFDLARRYESDGEPAAVGHGYGLYQFTGSTVNAFVHWLQNYPDDKLANYGRALADAKNFDGEWQMLGTVDPGHFSDLQDEFAKKIFFDETADMLQKEFFNVGNHSVAMQAVIFARSIQHGVFGCVELFKRACSYPNLSYVDDISFDRELIAGVYDYLIGNPSYGRGSHNLDDALRKRFIAERKDALA